MANKLKGSLRQDSDATFWPRVTRVMHLYGGLTAINDHKDPQIISIRQLTQDNMQVELNIEAYRDIEIALEGAGFGQIVGIDFYENDAEKEGAVLPFWVSNTPISNTTNGLFENRQFWRRVSHYGYSIKDARIIDISSRISLQIWTLGNSLRRVSNAYQQQRRSINHRACGKLTKYADTNTSHIFDSFQHFLFDACTFRDYLSEAVYEFIIMNSATNTDKRITSHAGLIAHLKKRGPSRHYLLKEVLEQSGNDGWFEKLRRYRNIITHVCPISQFNQTSSVILELIKLIDDKEITVIKSQFPRNPQDIEDRRESTVRSFTELEAMKRELNDSVADPAKSIDMLDYCCDVTKKLVLYSHEVGVAARLSAPSINIDIEN